jgi:hypothetical protein
VIGVAASLAGGAFLTGRPVVRRVCVFCGHRVARRIYLVTGRKAHWDRLIYQAWLQDNAE